MYRIHPTALPSCKEDLLRSWIFCQAQRRKHLHPLQGSTGWIGSWRYYVSIQCVCRNYVLHVNLHCVYIYHFIILWFSLVDQAVTLADVLVFWSGASSVPPMGFPAQSSLCFSDTAVYPTASTCALSLVLPTQYHDSYTDFKDNCCFAFLNHGGFGLM